MKAILKREIKSYFSSPVGYVCVAAIVALYGFFFFIITTTGTTGQITQVYTTMFQYCMMIIPIITMRSMSEDRKNKTDQILLTAPVSVTSIVIAKFLAAFSVYFIATTLGHIPTVCMNFFANPPYGLIFGNYIATLLYGAAMISIGVFISSLTESQVIAAVGTFTIAMLIVYVDTITQAIGSVFVVSIIQWFSFTSRYETFANGIFSFSSMLFFLSVSAVFIFLTARKLESRRWN